VRSPEPAAAAAHLLADLLDGDPLLAGLVGLVTAWDSSDCAARDIRAQQYATGRRLLKAVMRAVDIRQDPWRVEMPHPRLSLSHSGGLVAALGGPASAPPGIGIDIEHRRAVDKRSARFFLSGREQALWLAGTTAGRSAMPGGVLQPWTVKEAIFKADLGNRGHQLMDYTIRSVHARTSEYPQCSEIRWGAAERAGTIFHFGSAMTDDLIISIARGASVHRHTGSQKGNS
jgi:4'-phosphopantetheinyl transferase EntD